MRRRPRVLVVLGVAAWKQWVPAFLRDPAIEVACVAPEDRDDAFLHQVRRAGLDAAVFLSQHATLRRDLALAERLREAGLTAVACQPRGVAGLARNKRAMAERAAQVAGLEPIPELTPAEARRQLEEGRTPAIVAKRRDGTEGAGLRLIHRPVELGATATRLCEGGYLLQPFLEGEEYSVNLAWFEGRCSVYPPVSKGPTAPDALHPARRVRMCPAPLLNEPAWPALRQACATFLAPFHPSGFVEMELIRSGGRFYLLEVNPRVAATLRLTAAAAASNPLLDLVKAVAGIKPLGFAVGAARHAEEWPLPDTLRPGLRQELAARPYVWLSTRITVAADDPASLAARAADLRARLAGDAAGEGPETPAAAG